MTTFQITAVRTEDVPGSAHPHISAVGLGPDKAVISRAAVVDDLRNPNGDRYYTEARGIRATVIVVRCPVCGFSDYITTTPDSTTTNNLLSLPPC